MRISGTGITTFESSILPNFTVKTVLSLNWIQTESGNWYASDRGSSNDRYECSVTFHGLRGTVDRLLDQIYANRTAGVNEFYIDKCNSNEHIFGEDISYATTQRVTITNSPKIEQQGLKYYKVKMDLEIVDAPTFDATVPSTFPDLQYLAKGYSANTDDWTVTRNRLYDADYAYADSFADAGVFEGNFILTQAKTAQLRKYYRTNRGDSFTVSDIAGVTEPFGSLRGGTYPYTVKLLEVSEINMFGIARWLVKIRLAEVA